MITRVIKALPDWAALSVVIASAFGVSILYSVLVLALGQPNFYFSSADLRAGTIHQVLTLAVLGWFLWLRGWRLNDLGIGAISWRDVGWGAALFAAFDAVSSMVDFVASFAAPAALNELYAALLLTNPLDWSAIVATSLVNPIFEEVLVCALVIEMLRKRGPWAAIGVSCAIRTSYHLYQGVLGAVSIGLGGLLFAIFYWRYQRLWPVIIAHGALDFISLAMFGTT